MMRISSDIDPWPLPNLSDEGHCCDTAMVGLGKDLYFDPRLSQSHNISCNTCHQIGQGGVDMLPTSIGHKLQKGGRNAPTVLNAVFNMAQFWDGQAGGPIRTAFFIETRRFATVNYETTVQLNFRHGAASATRLRSSP